LPTVLSSKIPSPSKILSDSILTKNPTLKDKAKNTYQSLFKTAEDIASGFYSNVKQDFNESMFGEEGKAKIQGRVDRGESIMTREEMEKLSNLALGTTEPLKNVGNIVAGKVVKPILEQTMPEAVAKIKTLFHGTSEISAAQKAVKDGLTEEQYVASQVNTFHGTYTPKELPFVPKGALYTSNQKGASTYGTGKNVLAFKAKDGKMFTLNKNLMPKEWDKIIAKARADGYDSVKAIGTDFEGKKIPVTVYINSEKSLISSSQLRTEYQSEVAKIKTTLSSAMGKISSRFEGDTFALDKFNALQSNMEGMDLLQFVSKLKDVSSSMEGNRFAKEGISEIITKAETSMKSNLLNSPDSQLRTEYANELAKSNPPEIFGGFKDLTTKVLNKLEGRSSVSKQFISDLTNSGELKQAEREIIRKTLEDYGDGNIPVKEFAAVPLMFGDDKNEEPEILGGNYWIRENKITDDDLNEAKAILFGEISNRSSDKQVLEAKTILNTAFNRMDEYRRVKGKEYTLKEVLQMDNQYQAYKGKQYNKFKKGETDELDERKIKAIDSIFEKVKDGTFQNNVGKSVFYVHKPDGRIVVDNRSLFK